MQTENEKWMERQARKCSQVITTPEEINHYLEYVCFPDQEYNDERVHEMNIWEMERNGYG